MDTKLNEKLNKTLDAVHQRVVAVDAAIWRFANCEAHEKDAAWVRIGIEGRFLTAALEALRALE